MTIGKQGIILFINFDIYILASTIATAKTTTGVVKTSANTIGPIKPTTASVQPSSDGIFRDCSKFK